MAASELVGNVTQMNLVTSDNLGNKTETPITNKNLHIRPTANYQQVDDFAQRLAGLSSRTYEDTNLLTIISVQQKIYF